MCFSSLRKILIVPLDFTSSDTEVLIKRSRTGEACSYRSAEKKLVYCLPHDYEEVTVLAYSGRFTVSPAQDPGTWSCLGGTWGSILHLVTEAFILYIEDHVGLSAV